MAPDESSRDDAGDVHVFRYSLDDDGQPVKAIVKAVSWVKGVEVSDLDPLHSVIDVERLNACFNESGQKFYHNPRAKPFDLRLTFMYEGCGVTVTTDQIHVEDSPDG